MEENDNGIQRYFSNFTLNKDENNFKVFTKTLNALFNYWRPRLHFYNNHNYMNEIGN